MLDKLRNLFSGNPAKGSAAPSSHNPAFAPEQPLYIIGDVHGCDALLGQMLEAIETHGAAHKIEDPRLILLGDYVDRGPQSAQVLERIYTLQSKNPDQVICLMGNHEKMILDFIDDLLARAFACSSCLSHLPLLSGYDEPRTLS